MGGPWHDGFLQCGEESEAALAFPTVRLSIPGNGSGEGQGELRDPSSTHLPSSAAAAGAAM